MNRTLRNYTRWVFWLYGLFWALSCGLGAEEPRPPQERPLVVLCLGDSLTAGYGLELSQAWPAQVEARLQAEGYAVRLVNAGLSGETSAGGLRRAAWVLKRPADVLILALGANDALRSLPVESCREQLRSIIRLARERQPGLRILLAGMKAPPNLGPEYQQAFDGIYPALAAEEQVSLLPFLLEGVAGVPDLNQADGLHPTAEGQSRIASLLLPQLRPLLEAARNSAE